MSRKYSQRSQKEYNLFRRVFQWLTVKVAYDIYYRIVCGFEIIGRKNVPKKDFVIVASNHISALDPFFVIDAVGRPIAYMAKQELFEKPVTRFFLDWLGAFAVNRDKLGVSTIKTAIGIKETGWLLGLFPQGTRELDDSLENVAMGFVGLAKILKCPILPVGISGAKKEDRKPFEGKITIKIGEPIPYMENSDEMARIWKEKISELTRIGAENG
jgi:1-acyl-sn-glycerol-3-phosphate acyltransferase